MDLEDEKLSPFARAERAAAAARAKESARPAPSVGDASKPKPRNFGAGSSQVDQRAPFLATEAAQYLKAQQDRLEKARREAARARARTDAERLKSHLFIKRQELARVAARLRSAESALVAAEAEETRTRRTMGASAGAIQEKNAARQHLAAEREATERDFERREAAEAKAVQAIEHDMDQLVRRGGNRLDPRYQELERKRRDRERGLVSIQRERARRRTEASSRDAAVSRELASAERSEIAARRGSDLASTLAAKYRQQVRVFTVSRQALESDIERLRHDLALAEAAVRRADLEGK